MDKQDIIEELSIPEGLPEQALAEARKQQEAITQHYLNEIETFINGDEDEDFVPHGFLFGIHLLAEWRETRAYRPVCRLFHYFDDFDCPLDVELGESLTVTLHRALPLLCDGDAAPLKALVDNSAVDIFMRGMTLKAMVMAVQHDILERQQVADYLQSIYDRALFQGKDPFLWSCWVEGVAVLGLESMREQVHTLYDTVPELDDFLRPSMFDHSLAKYLGRAYDAKEALLGREIDSGLFTNCEAEFANWTFFFEEGEKAKFEEILERFPPDGDWREEDLEAYIAQMGEDESLSDDSPPEERQPTAYSAFDAPGSGQQAHNPYRDVGRNDPCPCGSGRKFKKCCRKSAA